jgi:four helix bundle protein
MEAAIEKGSSKGYRDLIVWQKGIGLVKEIYLLSARFPKEELYSLKTQIQRAAISVPSNIAEGQARGHQPLEFARFLKIALGSLAEIDTQLEVARELAYLNSEDTDRADELIEEIRRMLYGLVNSIAPR